jgi:DNA-binding IclR family transcriptional regulator
MELKSKKKSKKKASIKYSSPAVEQAGRILFCLAQNPSMQMGLVEICNKVGVSASKAYAILEALQKSELVKRGREGKGYSLGQGLVFLSRKYLDDLVPSKLAESVLEKLTRDTDKTSVFGLIIGDVITITARCDRGGNITIGIRTGRIMPITMGAHGKAIAAFLPEEELESLLKTDELYFHGTPKLLDRKRLMDELEQCRKDGFACDSADSTEGIIIVVAAPVIGTQNVPIGFVSIFDRGGTLEHARELGPIVAQACRNLSRQLGAEIN